MNFSRRDFIVAGASAGMMAAGNAAFGEVLGPEVRKLKGFAPLNVKRIFVEVGAEAGSIRQIKLSHGNIDAGVLDDGTRAFVGFANYNVSEVKGLVATFKLKKRYENVKTLDGVPVKVEWDGTTARCEFDLGDSQALLFR